MELNKDICKTKEVTHLQLGFIVAAVHFMLIELKIILVVLPDRLPPHSFSSSTHACALEW